MYAGVIQFQSANPDAATMDSFYAEKGHEQSRHDTSFSMSRSMRSMTRHELGDRTNGCISPAAEVDGKMRNPQRRRVPVACGRCRKRKIKCSGDSGDGQGCSNCRSAGNTDCQFLRMNSWSQQWPYPSLGPVVASSPRLARMYSHASAKPANLGMGSSQMSIAGLHELGSADAPVFPRPAVAIDSLPYESEHSATYSRSPAYILPTASSGAMVDYAVSPWSPKIWDSVLNVSKSSNTAMYPEPETTTSLNQSPFAYMLPSHGLPSTEIPQSTTAAMASIPSSNADRTLPTLTYRSQQLPASAASLNVLPSEGDSNLTLSADFKGNFWTPRCGTSPDQRTIPTTTVPSNAPFSSSSSPSIKCSSASANSSDFMFPYLPVPTTADEMISSVSSSTAPAPSTTTSANTSFSGVDVLETSFDYKSIPSDTRLSRNYSREYSSTGQRFLNACTPDVYAYSSSEKRARTTDDGDNRSSAGTLMSGLPYHRVRHPDTPSEAFSFNLFPDALPEYHRSVVENIQRPPVSPLGNHGAY